MSRCTLCGGKLASDGKCRECGFDNTKNDEKYRLNEHNAKGAALHQGACEDNLNRDRGRKEQQKRSGSGTAGKYDRSYEYTGTGSSKNAGKGSSEKTSGGTGKGSSAKTSNSTGKAGSAKRSGGAASGKSVRQASGSKKKSRLGVVLTVLLILLALRDLPRGLVTDLSDESDVFVSGVNYDWEEDDWEEDDWEDNDREDIRAYEDIADDAEDWLVTYPGEIIWDTEEDGYFELELAAGVYTGGYEIPAGTYQLNCTEGQIYVYWWNPDASEGGYALLYSEEAQKEYFDTFDMKCVDSAYSEQFELEEGGILYVEKQAGLKIAGTGDGTDALKEHTPQSLGGDLELQDEMTAGADFGSGAYDIMVEGENGSAYITIERNNSTYFLGLDAGEMFCRFPLAEGFRIKADLYGDAAVKIVPSY